MISGGWALARRAIAYELGMWRSLYLWIFRRRRTPGPGVRAFGYTGVVAPIFVAFIGVSAIEIPIVHLILPWPTPRRIALALGFYGLFWMIGLLASLRVHPHVVDAEGLTVRYGTTLDMTIPWDAIATVRTRYRSQTPGRNIRVEGNVQHIAIAHQTSVDVVFRDPTILPLPKGPSEPVDELWFYADDPGALVASAREQLTAEAASRDG